jgi:hypothetical protein
LGIRSGATPRGRINTNTRSQTSPAKGDIFTLLKSVTFSFCLDTFPFSIGVPANCEYNGRSKWRAKNRNFIPGCQALPLRKASKYSLVRRGMACLISDSDFIKDPIPQRLNDEPRGIEFFGCFCLSWRRFSPSRHRIRRPRSQARLCLTTPSMHVKT